MRWKYDTHVHGAALSLRDKEAVYAELFDDGDALSLVNAARFELPAGLIEKDHIRDGEELGEFLRGSLKFRWGKLPLALGIPASDCILRSFQMPAADLAEAISSLRWCSQDYLSYQYEDGFFDLCENGASPVSGQLELLGVACRRREVVPVLDALENYRCRVQALEPESVACTRALARLPDLAADALLVAAVGQTLHMICLRAGEPVFFHSVSLADDLTAPGDVAAQQVDREVAETAAYVSDKFNLTSLPIVCGGELPVSLSRIPSLRGAFNAASLAELGLGSDLMASDWFDVAGLLLRYADENSV